MNQLLQVRSNTYYEKTNEGLRELKELVFLTVKPSYKLSNEHELVRERTLSEFRVVTTKDQIDTLIKTLEKVRDTE